MKGLPLALTCLAMAALPPRARGDGDAGPVPLACRGTTAEEALAERGAAAFRPGAPHDARAHREGARLLTLAGPAGVRRASELWATGAVRDETRPWLLSVLAGSDREEVETFFLAAARTGGPLRAAGDGGGRARAGAHARGARRDRAARGRSRAGGAGVRAALAVRASTRTRRGPRARRCRGIPTRGCTSCGSPCIACGGTGPPTCACSRRRPTSPARRRACASLPPGCSRSSDPDGMPASCGGSSSACRCPGRWRCRCERPSAPRSRGTTPRSRPWPRRKRSSPRCAIRRRPRRSAGCG